MIEELGAFQDEAMHQFFSLSFSLAEILQSGLVSSLQRLRLPWRSFDKGIPAFDEQLRFPFYPGTGSPGNVSLNRRSKSASLIGS